MSVNMLERDSKVRTVRDGIPKSLTNNTSDVDLFDDSTGYEDESGVKLADGLSSAEQQQAVQLYKLFNGLWGCCIVVGQPGTGKDLFGNYISYKIKRLFPWKRIMRDEKPRALFGPYAGLFNEKVLAEDLKKLREIAAVGTTKTTDGKLDKAADDWVAGTGQVMLKNSVLYLTEFWRYCYNREPHNPMNKTMGAIHKTKRHLDCLILGTTQLTSDLDKKTCLPFVDWQTTCTKSLSNPTGFVYYVSKVRYDSRLEKLIHVGQPFPIAFDAGKPVSYLGDGKIVIKKPKYRTMSDEEDLILKTIAGGVHKYEDLITALEDEIDACDVLTVLKELKFKKSKRVIEFPCFFGLYNSKSAPSIKSSVKLED